MQIFIYVMIFVFGLILGSFYNVVGYRLPKKQSIVFPASHCPKCKHKLRVLDLFPVFSYLFLGGKCRYCKKKISIIYPLIEILTASLFLLSYYLYGPSIKFLISIVFVSVAIITIVSDIRYMIIDDIVLIIGGILILILGFIEGGYKEALDLIINALLSFIIMLVIKISADHAFKKEAMGGGDVKLMTLIGALVSYQMSVITLCLSAFVAFPYAIYVYFSKDEHLLPLGPFLCLSGLILFFLGLDFGDLMAIMAK